LENPLILKSKLEEGFEKWRKNIGISPQFYYYKNLSEKTWGESSITMEEAARTILNEEKISSISNRHKIPIILTEDSKSKLENEAGDSGKQEIQQFPANSKAGYQCPVCKRFDKPMFFANEQDLELHIQRLHSGHPNHDW